MYVCRSQGITALGVLKVGDCLSTRMQNAVKAAAKRIFPT